MQDAFLVNVNDTGEERTGELLADLNHILYDLEDIHFKPQS